jgi:hypothetical protein
MPATTPVVMALAGAALAVPAAALAAQSHTGPPSAAALRAPIAGHRTVAAQMHAARDARLRTQLSAEAARLAELVATARGSSFHAARFRAVLRGEAPRSLRTRVTQLRGALARAQRSRAVSTPAYLQAIAVCESGGNPSTDTGNGFYGKYQFTRATWASVGGTGNPAAAPEAEQDRRAATLYARSGSSSWPNCGR